MSIWDDPAIRGDVGDYVKLTAEGDEFSGVILKLGVADFGDGPVPQLEFRDDTTGAERTWTAGQVQARIKLTDERPEVGDHIRVRLDRLEKRGSKTLKHLDITVTRAAALVPAGPARDPHQSSLRAVTERAVTGSAESSPERRNRTDEPPF